MNSQEKRKIVEKKIDISNNRFDSFDLDRLVTFVGNCADFIGKTVRTTKTDYNCPSSDGRFDRTHEYERTLNEDENGKLYINEKHRSYDDDGTSDSYPDKNYTKGREILDFIHLFKK